VADRDGASRTKVAGGHLSGLASLSVVRSEPRCLEKRKIDVEVVETAVQMCRLLWREVYSGQGGE
jgi:hypothetical protein